MGIQDINTHEIQTYLDELEQCGIELNDIINRSQKAISHFFDGFYDDSNTRELIHRNNLFKDDLLIICKTSFKDLPNYIREKYGLDASLESKK